MNQDDPEPKIDAWLDEALSRYSATEPRAGLERRVLESLRAESRRVPRRWWKVWAPALATAAAAIVLTVVVVVVVVVVVRNRDFPPERTVTPEHASAQAPAAPSETVARERYPEATTGGRKPANTEQSSPQESAKAVRAVTLRPHPGSMFPVAAPLSEQERLVLAAMQSGLLSSAQPGIPPGDEPLPKVAIQEVQIRPLREIEPI